MEKHPYLTDTDGEASPVAETLHITLQLEGDDPAFTNTIALDVLTSLQNNSYSIEPVYTGQRGGGLLVEIGMTLAQALTFVKDNHATISEGIGDLGGLAGICTGVVPLCKQMLHATAKHTQTGLTTTETTVPVPIKITVEIDGHPISIEASNLEQAKAVIILVRQFATAYPAAAKQASPATSKVKAHGQITRPPRQKRGGRR